MFWRLFIGFLVCTLLAASLAAGFVSGYFGHSYTNSVIALIALGATVLAIIPAYFLTRWFIRPLHQLKGDKQQLRTILGGMVEGVIAVDSRSRVLFANVAAGRMLDFDAQTAVGLPFTDLCSEAAFLEAFTKALEGSPAHRVQITLNGGRARDLTLYVAPQMGEVGTGAVMVLHDMTELHRLERMRRDFAANVSHELKTPLTIIQSNLEALLDGAIEESDVRRPFLEQISEQSARLYALILDLLQLSAIESQDIFYDFGSVDLAQAVAECVERHSKRAEAKDTRLTIQPPEGGRRAFVWADEDALHQILDNLVDNAVKYTQPAGEVRIAWWVNGDSICIEVRDNGPGIPERDLSRIFERFYRVDKARSRSMGGTGLGLAIVKHLVQVMKGTVSVRSSDEVGTTFTLRLPKAGENKELAPSP